MRTSTLLFTCLSLLFFAACSEPQAKTMKRSGIQAVIFNKTGYDLDSVYLGDAYVGKIGKDKSVEVINCRELGMQDGAPFMLAAGVINGKKKDRRPVGYCGTGVSTAREGNFEFDIHMQETEFGYRLQWDVHRN
jgi:hypothetical protein